MGINALVKPMLVSTSSTSSFTFFPNVQTTFWPIIYGTQDSVISASQASEFRSDVLTPLKILDGLWYGGISLASVAGIACIILFLCAICVRRHKHSKQQVEEEEGVDGEQAEGGDSVRDELPQGDSTAPLLNPRVSRLSVQVADPAF